jgi:hypothetical protein
MMPWGHISTFCYKCDYPFHSREYSSDYELGVFEVCYQELTHSNNQKKELEYVMIARL